MKKQEETTLNMLINKMEDSKVAVESPSMIPFINGFIDLLKSLRMMERYQLEKAFEDGVGEGMTDPERPLNGKEYYDIKFKQ